MKIALFISSHGFGHAARSCALAQALAEQVPGLRLELFSETPSYFFEASLKSPFGYHTCPTDLGIVQTSALEGDLKATLAALGERLPFPQAQVEHWAEQLSALKIDAVIADISPLGILAAKAAQIPVFLSENFTWDWIYAHFEKYTAEFSEFVRYLEGVYRLVDFRLSLHPACKKAGESPSVRPLARKPRQEPAEVRRRLGLQRHEKLILLTLGGIQGQILGPPKNCTEKPWRFLSPVGHGEGQSEGNWRLLGEEEGFYHPDLMGAADLVVCKLGYSTLAEAWQSGTPVLYLSRADFAETASLERFCAEELVARPLHRSALLGGDWGKEIEAIVNRPKGPRRKSGAEELARWIVERIE